MRNSANICSLGITLLLLAACQARQSQVRVTETLTTGAHAASFDPLGLPQDTVLPFDISARMPGPEAVQYDSVATGGLAPVDRPLGLVYRVQLLTTNTYSEGRRVLRVAEEIFDQPVFLDYDLPNFKLRVGSFATSRDAEAYLKRATDAGYQNPWVVAVPAQMHRVPPLIDTTGTAADSVASGDRE